MNSVVALWFRRQALLLCWCSQVRILQMSPNFFPFLLVADTDPFLSFAKLYNTGESATGKQTLLYSWVVLLECADEGHRFSYTKFCTPVHRAFLRFPFFFVCNASMHHAYVDEGITTFTDSLLSDNFVNDRRDVKTKFCPNINLALNLSHRTAEQIFFKSYV